MNKFFKEVITSKSLDFKLSGQFTDPLVDSLIEHYPHLKTQFKNVCAPIPLALNDELENILAVLELSKGKFLTMAIVSAMDEAKALMEELDITEYRKELVDESTKSKTTLELV